MEPRELASVFVATCTHLDEDGVFTERGYATCASPGASRHDSLHDRWLFIGEEALPESEYWDSFCVSAVTLEFGGRTEDSRVLELVDLALDESQKLDAQRIARSPSMPGDRKSFDMRAVRFVADLFGVDPSEVTLHYHANFYSREKAVWIVGRGPRTNTVGVTVAGLDLGARTMLVFEERDRGTVSDGLHIHRLFLARYCGGEHPAALESPDITSKSGLDMQLSGGSDAAWTHQPLPPPMRFSY